jgi:hypothetical protein
MSQSGARLRRESPRPEPASRAYYLERAEDCLAAAGRTRDAVARQLHEEECKFWLRLAYQREAIEAVLQRYIDARGAA